APGHACANSMTSSYRSNAARPGCPTTRAEYFSRLETPGLNSCSCAFSIVREGDSSEPAITAVPLERPADALAKGNRRRVADLAACARDVESPALRVELDAAAVNRRFDPQRDANRFGDCASEPERPDRQMQPRRRHASFLRNQSHQLVQGRHLTTCQD